MQKFYGVQLVILTGLLNQIKASFTATRETQKHYGLKPSRVVIDDEMKQSWLQNTLAPMSVIAVRTNLKSTEAYLDRIKQKLAGAVHDDEMHSMVEQLNERIEDDLKNELLFHVSQERAKYYEPTELVEYKKRSVPLFGAKVDESFPSARFDIDEAGKCLALDRSTACVMHLARATEVILKALAEDELNLPTRYDWGKYLNEIEAELTKRYKVAGARTEREKFYSEAANLIGHIKVAWRNPTMHVDRKYTDAEAEKILLATRSFMEYLAEAIKEKA